MSTMRCKCRRQAETGLRCVRCSVPICPDCSRNAPVGFLCRSCAGGRRDSPLFRVDGRSLALGYAGSLAAGVAGGWLMATVGVGLGFFGCFLAYAYGIAVAEVALRITGRKRGPHIEIMAGVSAALGLIGGLYLHLLTLPPLPRQFANGVATPSYMTLYLSNPVIYVIAAVAIYGAVSRIRNI